MNTLCVFDVGDRRVGVDMLSVREVIEQPIPTPVPLTPEFVHGLFNLRGEVVTLLNLAPFVGANAQPSSQHSRALILHHRGLRIAVPAETIQSVALEAPVTDLHSQASIYPALEAEQPTTQGLVHVLNLDRLCATVSQSLRFADIVTVAPQPQVAS